MIFIIKSNKFFWKAYIKGQLISKQNCRAHFSQKTKETPQDKYYPEFVPFVYWENLRLENFISRSTDL